MDGILDLPDLAFGAAAVRGRIHDDRIIVVPSADFPFYKFHTVVYDPADGFFFQAAGSCVFSGPSNHAFGGVHMSDCRAGRSGGKGGAAGIGEEI